MCRACVWRSSGHATTPRPDHCRRFNSTTASEHQRVSVLCRESCGHQHQNAPFNHIGHPVHGCVFLSHRTLCHLVCFVHVAMSVGFVHTCMLKVCNACTHSEHKLKCELVRLMLLAAGTGTLQRTKHATCSVSTAANLKAQLCCHMIVDVIVLVCCTTAGFGVVLSVVAQHHSRCLHVGVCGLVPA